jgi:uncharacterized RDD family membrane protein YckC
MGARIEFQTPENITVSYPLAGAGSRYLAFIVDMLILFGIAIAFTVLVLFALFLSVILDVTGGLFTEANAAILAIVSAIIGGFSTLLYFIIFEMIWDGQTPGKRLLRCRVVMEHGFSLGAAAVFLRGIFRVIDVVPVLWIVPLANEKVQRFGDMVAGTVVVMEDEAHVSPMRELLLAREPERIQYRFSPAQLLQLTDRDVEALEKYCERRDRLPGKQRSDIAAKIARGLSRRVGMAEPVATDDEEQFIADLLDAHYRREARELA